MIPFKTAIAVMCCLFVWGQSALAGDVLGPEELQGLAPGRYQVTLLGIVHMTVTMRLNGTVVGATAKEQDFGRWNLHGDKLCIAWNKWLGGRARCSELTSQGSYYQGSGFTFRRI